MNDMSKHSILLVADPRKSLISLGRILEKQSLSVELADSGKQAIEAINTRRKPFSITIADQSLEDMSGTRFLEQVKKISSYTQRFILADFSDIESIIQAVNKGTIQGCIKKPWQEDSLMKVVKQGIQLFESNFENKRLMRLAKKQNHKLFELDCELMEKTKSHTKDYQALETEINRLKKKVRNLNPEEILPVDDPVALINQTAGNPDNFDKEKAKPLLHESIRLLHSWFTDLAAKNGFDMPLPGDDRPC